MAEFSISTLENRERVQRRTGSAFNRQRRESDHELIAAKLPCGFDSALKIEVLNDVDADVFQNHLMDRVSLDALVWSPARPWEPVDVEVVPEERGLPLLHPWECIDKVAGDL